jgi:hypothetical protein
MFVHNEQSRLCYLVPEPAPPKERISDFALVGRLLGMALYNSITMNFGFPSALFKKLYNKQPSLEDLEELDPVGAFGLPRNWLPFPAK